MSVPIEGQVSAEREPTQDEIQAVVDTIDLLIAAEEVPPYDVDLLPKTAEELVQHMIKEGKAIAGMYPADVPTVPLLLIDNLSRFSFKRFPRESAAHHSGIAQVHRRWPLPDLGLEAEMVEVVHIQESTKGLKVHREFSESYNDGRMKKASDFFWEQDMHKDTGMERVSAEELKKIKLQLTSSRIIQQ